MFKTKELFAQTKQTAAKGAKTLVREKSFCAKVTDRNSKIIFLQKILCDEIPQALFA
jgi:hypothetical protein